LKRLFWGELLFLLLLLLLAIAYPSLPPEVRDLASGVLRWVAAEVRAVLDSLRG